MSERVLGLDLGTASVGWALVEFEGEAPAQIIGMGSRVFDPGMDGSIEEGKEESRNTERREARQRRRMTQRRARRMRKIGRILQRHRMFPECNVDNPVERDAAIKAVDQQLSQRYESETNVDQLPYFLRQRALDAPLDLLELGRALYHLSQRRGFLSNRKAEKDDEDEGKVKQAIGELREAMTAADTRTLGEHLAGRNPHEKRIRGQYTERKMYREEFRAIWDAQFPHHRDVLTESFRVELEQAMLHQRPLKSAKALIGRCDLEPERPGAPWALLESQRFRILQRLNDLQIIWPDGRRDPLTPEQRQALLAQLEQQQSMSFGAIRTLLKKQFGLPKTIDFNLAQGGEKELPGNKTAARLREVFGAKWDAFSDEERRQIVHDVRSIRKEDVLARRGAVAWGLDAEAAKNFGKVKLEKGYCRHSRQALAKLLPRMEEGESYATAKKAEYGDPLAKRLICDLLPPVADTDVALRNPAVMRSLSELRKVVNGVIRTYGKPDRIRIELARDLKRPKGERQKKSKEMRERQKERDAARKKVTEVTGNPHPSRSDIEKVLLWEECNRECPYTGKSIELRALLGDSPQFDIEHIVPFSRCLDDSYMNKTLCQHEFNRSAKGNRTPYECMHGTPDWEEAIERVKRFKGNAAKGKLRRFLQSEIEGLDDFVARQLNDTRYASTQALAYLGWLYGRDARKHMQATSGQVTAYLRNAWKLNKILNDGGTKTRDDHRHHAVDALAIALSSPAMVHQLSRASEQQLQAKGRSRGWWKTVQEPWVDFLEDAHKAVEAIVVSHRMNHKVNGNLHEETNYSPPKHDEKGKPFVHIRKPITRLSGPDMKNIVDPEVSAAIEEALERSGMTPDKCFNDPANLPKHPRNGSIIKRVRVKKSANPLRVGPDDDRARWVIGGSNHHAEIIEVTDKKGRTKWEDVIVTTFEAMQRLRRGEPIIQRDHRPGSHFLFSLHMGDTIELDTEDGGRALYVVRSISKGDINYVRLTDARLKKEIQAQKDWGRVQSMATFQALNPQKKMVSPLGEVFNAGG